MEYFLTLNEVEQNNLSQGKTKQNTFDLMDVSSQDTFEKPRLGDNKMVLDLIGLGSLSMAVDKGKKSSSLVEMGNAFTQFERVDVPTVVQGSSSMNIEVVPSTLGAGYPSPAKSVPLLVHDVSLEHIAVLTSAPSLVGSETFSVGKEIEDRNVVE